MVRLGAMGDIVHALAAVATLKHSFPNSHVTWAVEPKWACLLDGNPFLDALLPAERHTLRGFVETWRNLRGMRFDWAVDFQGLVKSAGFRRSGRREVLPCLDIGRVHCHERAESSRFPFAWLVMPCDRFHDLTGKSPKPE